MLKFKFEGKGKAFVREDFDKCLGLILYHLYHTHFLT